MTQFIVVRHGYSKSNENGCFTGQTDVALSALGVLQAQKTADYLIAHFSPDRIYSSDLSRALQTAQPVADALRLPVTPDTALREINGGQWEEKTPEQIMRLYPDEYSLWLRDIGSAQCPGGETMQQVQTRALRALHGIAAEHPTKTVLIFTHAGVIRALQCAWQNIPLGEMKNVPWVPNASISVADYDNGVFTVRQIGYADHLQGIQTELPKDI